MSGNYDFNALTNRFDLVGPGGGSGGSGITAINPDEGAPITGTAGVVNAYGVESLTSPVMQTINESGDLGIENRAHLTRYVVDGAITTGERGTYSSIQAAIDQAFIDGAIVGSNNKATIYIRPGLYDEDLTWDATSYMHLVCLDSLEVGVGSVTIFGNTTIPDSVNLSFEGLTFANTTGQDVVDVQTSSGAVLFDRCFIYSQGIANALIISGNSGSGIEFSFGAIAGPISHNGGGAAAFFGTRFTNSYAIGANSTVTFTQCLLNQVQINDANVSCYNCVSSQESVITGTSLEPPIIVNCAFVAAGAPSIDMANSEVLVSNCTFGTSIATEGTIITLLPGSQGNIMVNRVVDDDYVVDVNDYSISVNGAAPVTIQLPDNPFEGQTVHIKDTSGAAGTNAITIDGSGNTIDGSGFILLNTNYGAYELRAEKIYGGGESSANWFIISNYNINDNSGTALQAGNNLSDLTDVATARTNLGLGTAATMAATAFLQATNNLSDLANAATARTNLGLGTAATQAATAFLQATNNLSDLANATTARSNLGVAIGSQVQAWDADLDSISAVAANGILVRTGAGNWTTRTITAGLAVAVTNGNGQAANPTIAVTGGGLAWATASGTTQQMVANTAYFANNASLVTLTLPNGGTIGDVVKVVGQGAGGWRVAQNSGQFIVFGNQTTTTGVTGSISSTNAADVIEIVLSSSGWRVVSAIGNLTVV